MYRILDEQIDHLQEHLSPRWILSTLRSVNEFQREKSEAALALSGFLYGSLIRIYEAERVMDERPLEKALFEVPRQGVKTGVEHLGRYLPGKDNGASINNVLLMQDAVNGGVVGQLILALMVDVKHSPTIFSRVDQELVHDPEFRERPSIWGFGCQQDASYIGRDELKKK